MATQLMAGRPLWQWLLFIGAAVNIVAGLMLVTTDRSGFPPAVARDVLIVGVLSIVGSAIVVLLAPTAADHKVVRRIAMGVIALMVVVALMGVLSQAVTPIVAGPAIFLVVGMLLLFRDLKAAQPRANGA